MPKQHGKVADTVGFSMRPRPMAGIDTIFPYQFVVYVFMFIWGIRELIFLIGKPPIGIAFMDDTVYLSWLWAFAVSPPVALFGYLLQNRTNFNDKYVYIGLSLSFSGNASISSSTWTYTILLIVIQGYTLATVAIAALSTCMTIRAIRDLIFIHRLNRFRRLMVKNER